MGFETPRLPTQPREHSKYLGQHIHAGKKGDRNRRTASRPIGKAHSGMFSWVKK